MSGNPKGIELLAQYSEGLYSDFEYETDASDQTLKIDCGVLFLMAFWSGPSVIGFKNICSSLTELDTPRSFRFCVLDIDGATDLMDELSRHEIVIGGGAEAYWFKHGKIITATAVHTGTSERIKEIVEGIKS